MASLRRTEYFGNKCSRNLSSPNSKPLEYSYLFLSFILGNFNMLGVAEGSVEESLGKISTLRLNVHSESENWAILSEVSLISF